MKNGLLSCWGPFAPSLQPLTYRRDVASTTLSYRYYFGIFSSELAEMGGPFVILIGCKIYLSPIVNVIRMFMSMASFLFQLNSGILRL